MSIYECCVHDDWTSGENLFFSSFFMADGFTVSTFCNRYDLLGGLLVRARIKGPLYPRAARRLLRPRLYLALVDWVWLFLFSPSNVGI